MLIPFTPYEPVAKLQHNASPQSHPLLSGLPIKTAGGIGLDGAQLGDTRSDDKPIDSSMCETGCAAPVMDWLKGNTQRKSRARLCAASRQGQHRNTATARAIPTRRHHSVYLLRGATGHPIRTVKITDQPWRLDAIFSRLVIPAHVPAVEAPPLT